MSRAYAPVRFDPPERAAGYTTTMWFRVFRCSSCQTILGRQRIGLRYGGDAAGQGQRPVGYRIERVELARGLIALDPTDDGLLSFGLPQRVHLEPPPLAGLRRRSMLRRDTLVLPSVESVDNLGIPQRGDPYHVARHAPNRARSAQSEFVLALTDEQASLPFVVTCLDLRCRRRWLVGGLPGATELEAAPGPPGTAV